MRIVLALLNEDGEDDGSMIEELREHFAWVNDGQPCDFFARLHNDTQRFMQERGPFYFCLDGDQRTITGLKAMVTNSALTFYPQFSL